jgi:hypothetical protein
MYERAYSSTSDEASRREALEDFTTEALAGAISWQAGPFLDALSARGVDLRTARSTRPFVTTQRTHRFDGAHPDEVRLDLVLAWPDAHPPIELWVEIKVGAGLSGVDQLNRYERAMNRLAEREARHAAEVVRPPLVLLSRDDLTQAIGHTNHDPVRADRPPTHVSWQHVADAVARSSEPNTLWLDLASFLKEIGMTRDRSFPVTAREATSLTDAHSLYLKSVELLQEVNRRGRESVGSSRFSIREWWGNGLESFVRREFRDHGRFSLGIWNGSPIGLGFGLSPADDGEATYAVWVSVDPKLSDVRAQAFGLIDKSDLIRSHWITSYEGWHVVTRRDHVMNFSDRDSAAEWFLERFDELEAAGVLALQQRLSRHTPEMPLDRPSGSAEQEDPPQSPP